MRSYTYGGYSGYAFPSDTAISEEIGAGERPLDLRYYWYAVLEHRWLVVITFLLVMAGALFYLIKAPRIYEASVRLQIDPEFAAESLLEQPSTTVVRVDQDYLETQYKRLTSRSLLEAVIRRERLDQDPRYRKAMDIVEALSKDVSVKPVRMTRLVDVRVYHTDPRKAAAIANAIAEEFIKVNATQRQKRVLDILFLLKTQAAELEREVTQKEEAVQRYREQKSFVSFETNENVIALALSQAQSRYAEAKARATTAQRNIKELEDYLKGGNPVENFPLIASDQEITALRLELAKLENELASFLQRYKDKHPAVIELRSKIEAVRNSIRQMAEERKLQLYVEASLAKAQEQELADNVAYWEERQMEWNKAKGEYEILKRQAEISQQLYALILGKMKEIDMATSSHFNNVVVVDPAVAPMMYVKPNLAVTLTGGVLGGLVLAIGLALVVAYLDDSIKGQEDIENYLRIPFLGYVPDIHGKDQSQKAIITHLEPQSVAAESFRTIRAALVLSAQAEPRKVMLVTSSLPGEGKSLCASNLAIVFAQTNTKTLIIDADLRRPALHRNFKAARSPGLSNYLSGETSIVDEIIQHTEIPNLDIITAGSSHPQPAELLSSKLFERLIRELLNRYERIIIDSPPLSATSDPMMIASFSDGVIYVIKFNKVRREFARKCLQRFIENGIPICGAVVNDLSFEGSGAYYAYYYSHYYHYYHNKYYYRYGHKEKGYRSPQKSEVTSIMADQKPIDS